MVWRQVGVIGAGHRLGAAAAGACRTGVPRSREQNDGENLHQNLHHGYLSFRLTMRRQNNPGIDIEVPMYDLTTSVANAFEVQ
jgi:hypothetical protein